MEVFSENRVIFSFKCFFFLIIMNIVEPILAHETSRLMITIALKNIGNLFFLHNC